MNIVKIADAKVGKSYVYCAEFNDGLVKIGVSKNAIQRLKNISRKNHCPIKRQFLVEGGYQLEAHLHEKYKKERRYGEWFALNYLNLQEEISSLTPIKEIKKKPITDNKVISLGYDILNNIHNNNMLTEILNTLELYTELDKAQPLNKCKMEYRDYCKANSIDETETEEELEDINSYGEFYINIVRFEEYFVKDTAYKYLNRVISYKELITELVTYIDIFITDSKYKSKKQFVQDSLQGYTHLRDILYKISSEEKEDCNLYVLYKKYIIT